MRLWVGVAAVMVVGRVGDSAPPSVARRRYVTEDGAGPVDRHCFVGRRRSGGPVGSVAVGGRATGDARVIGAMAVIGAGRRHQARTAEGNHHGNECQPHGRAGQNRHSALHSREERHGCDSGDLRSRGGEVEGADRFGHPGVRADGKAKGARPRPQPEDAKVADYDRDAKRPVRTAGERHRRGELQEADDKEEATGRQPVAAVVGKGGEVGNGCDRHARGGRATAGECEHLARMAGGRSGQGVVTPPADGDDQDGVAGVIEIVTFHVSFFGATNPGGRKRAGGTRRFCVVDSIQSRLGPEHHSWTNTEQTANHADVHC